MMVPKFKRLLWALNEFRNASPRGITVKQLSDKWSISTMNEEKEEGIPLRTFFRIRNSVQEAFGIEIECIKGVEPRYRISNQDLEPGNNNLMDLFFNKSKNDDSQKSNSIREIIGMLMLGKDISPDDMQMIEQIKNTLNKIPYQYCRQLHKLGKEGKIAGADCCAWDEDYCKYVCVWNKETYESTTFWISVGFYNNAIYFYLVSNSQDEIYREELSKYLKIEDGEQYRQDYWWYKPQDHSLFQYNFQTFPKMEEVIHRIELLLSKIAVASRQIKKKNQK